MPDTPHPHILLIGANGQLGTDMAIALKRRCKLSQAQRSGTTQIDLSKPDSLREKILELSPDLVINCAAYTAVDKAESEPLLAQTVNGESPGVIAKVCRELGIMLIHFSTDYVYDGSARFPISEDTPTNPLNEYGRSKLLGDEAITHSGCEHIIFRTSWVYAKHGRNFLNTMIKLASEKDELNIVDDQTGSPTWTGYLARETGRIALDILSRESNYPSGIYNLTCSQSTTWFGFASEIFSIVEALGVIKKIPRLFPVSSSEYPTPAIRPAYSVLDSSKAMNLLHTEKVNWKTALQSCLRNTNPK